ERVLDNPGYLPVVLPELRDLVDDCRPALDGLETLGDEAAAIRELLRDAAPAEPRPAIQIRQLARKVADVTLDLRRRAEEVIAEQVAPEERDAAAEIGAERIGAHADRRLADELEPEVRLIRPDRELLWRRQPGRRVGKHARHVSVVTPDRRQRRRLRPGVRRQLDRL